MEAITTADFEIDGRELPLVSWALRPAFRL